MAKSTFIAAWIAAAILCVGCGGRGTAAPEAHSVAQDPVKAELEKSKKEYKEQFGGEVSFSCNDLMVSDKDVLAVLKHALKNNRPFPNHRIYVDLSDAVVANYELRFNRKIPNVKFADDVCKGNTHSVPYSFFGDIDTTDCQSKRHLYRDYLLGCALHKNEPLPENITVTELDLWMAVYERFTGKKSFPAWFGELSYKDKIMYLDFAVGAGFWGATPYLSKEKEDSIKTELEKEVSENEELLGREMTEFEKIKTEYEVQFDEPVPACECSDEELPVVLKRLIKRNMKIYGDTIDRRTVAKLEYENRFRRRIPKSKSDFWPVERRDFLSVFQRPKNDFWPVKRGDFSTVLHRALRTGIPYPEYITNLDILKAVYEELFRLPVPGGQYSDAELYAVLKWAIEKDVPCGEGEKITELEKNIAEYERRFNRSVKSESECMNITDEKELLKKLKKAIKSGKRICTRMIFECSF